MMLSHSVFDTPIVFEENKINVLVIENCDFLMRSIQDLKLQSEEDTEGEFVLSDGDDVGFKNTVVITDMFSLDINSKKNLTKLYAYLSEFSRNETYFGKTLSVLSEIQSFVAEISEASDYNLSASETDVRDLFKICDLKFAVDSNTEILEKLCSYISVLRDFLKTKLFVLVNLRQFVSENNITEFYKYTAYNKINVLLIESSCPEVRLDCEKYKIIDKDLCEIS